MQKLNLTTALKVIILHSTELFGCEMKNLDNPDFLDEFTFSVDQIEQRTTGSIVLVSNLISNAVGLITSMAIVGFIHLGVIILVLFVVMISLIFSHALTRIQFKADHEMVLPNHYTFD